MYCFLIDRKLNGWSVCSYRVWSHNFNSEEPHSILSPETFTRLKILHRLPFDCLSRDSHQYSLPEWLAGQIETSSQTPMNDDRRRPPDYRPLINHPCGLLAKFGFIGEWSGEFLTEDKVRGTVKNCWDAKRSEKNRSNSCLWLELPKGFIPTFDWL